MQYQYQLNNSPLNLNHSSNPTPTNQYRNSQFSGMDRNEDSRNIYVAPKISNEELTKMKDLEEIGKKMDLFNSQISELQHILTGCYGQIKNNQLLINNISDYVSKIQPNPQNHLNNFSRQNSYQDMNNNCLQFSYANSPLMNSGEGNKNNSNLSNMLELLHKISNKTEQIKIKSPKKKRNSSQSLTLTANSTSEAPFQNNELGVHSGLNTGTNIIRIFNQ